MAQIGDLLVKLNNGIKLQPAEEQELRLWGNQTQIYNAYIGGLQNGASSINAFEVSANNIRSQKNILSGGMTQIYYNYSVPTGGSYTTMDVQAVFFNDLFSVSGNTFTFLKTGFYLFHAEIGAAITDGTLGVLNFQGLSRTMSFFDQGEYGHKYYSFRKNQAFTLQGKHEEVGSVLFNVRIFFQLLREYEAAVTT